MSRLLFGCVTVLATAVWLSGCGSPPEDTQPEPSTSAGGDQAGHEDEGDSHAGHGDEHAGHAHGDAGADKIKAALAQLSDEDRALAEKQKDCPVSGEALGSMGKPIKLEVNGQNVFICCGGCEDKMRASPDVYLAKLKTE